MIVSQTRTSVRNLSGRTEINNRNMSGEATFDVSVAMTNKDIVLWDVTPCSLATVYGLSEELFDSIRAGITLPQFFIHDILWDDDAYLPDYTASYPTRQQLSVREFGVLAKNRKGKLLNTNWKRYLLCRHAGFKTCRAFLQSLTCIWRKYLPF